MLTCSINVAWNLAIVHAALTQKASTLTQKLGMFNPSVTSLASQNFSFLVLDVTHLSAAYKNNLIVSSYTPIKKL